jgi:hypothetical protein
MFPAPLIPRGRDLNEIEQKEQQRTLDAIFGNSTEESVSIARRIQTSHVTPQLDINALFEEINREQNEGAQNYAKEDTSAAASSIPVQSAVDDEFVEVVQPAPAKTSRKSSGKSKATASVVKKPSENSF